MQSVALLFSRFMILGKGFLSLAKLHAYKNANIMLFFSQSGHGNSARSCQGSTFADSTHTQQKISKCETVSQLSQLTVPGMLHRLAQGGHIVHSG